MRRVLMFGLLFAFMGYPVRAEDEVDDGDPVQELIQEQDQKQEHKKAKKQEQEEEQEQDEEQDEEQEKEQVHHFKVHKHLFAKSVYADKNGICKATGNRQLKAWYVVDFPAEIPPFESCTTISSSTTSGDVDIELTVFDSKGSSILRLDGVLELPEDGKSSQAVDWDHLKIRSPGKHFMEIRVEGKKVGRFPMLFKKKKGRRKRK